MSSEAKTVIHIPAPFQSSPMITSGVLGIPGYHPKEDNKSKEDPEPEFLAGGLKWKISTRSKTQKESEPERLVKHILSELKLEWRREVMHKNLKHRRALRLDFYIPALNLCIEADGDRHFLDGMQMERDRSKDLFCHEHKVSMLRLAFYGDVKKMNDYGAARHIRQIVAELRDSNKPIMRAIGKDYHGTKWEYIVHDIDYDYHSCCTIM